MCKNVVSERYRTENNKLTDNVCRYAVGYIKKSHFLQWEIYIAITHANKDNCYKLEQYRCAHIAPLTEMTLSIP